MSSCGFLLLSAVFSTTGRAFSTPWLITASLFIAGSQGTSLECDIRPVKNVIFPGHLAVFECEATGGVTDWIINGTNYNNNTPEVREDMIKNENSMPKTLTISNTFKYNNTQVQCKTYESIEEIYPYAESEIATLLIQGVLSAVGQLILKSNATSITISWTAPWSLVHDIWYSVLIQNITDEDNPMIVDYTNITETCYTFTPHHLSASHKYNITVTPFNGAGQGENRSNITSSIDRGSQVSSSVLTTVTDPADTTTPIPTPDSTPPHDNDTKSDRIDYRGFYALPPIIIFIVIVIVFGVILYKLYRRARDHQQQRYSFKVPAKDLIPMEMEREPEPPPQLYEENRAWNHGVDDAQKDFGRIATSEVCHNDSQRRVIRERGKDKTSVRRRGKK